MKYRIGICDDEIFTCSEIEDTIIKYFHTIDADVETYVWYQAEEFMKDVPDKVELDILFLDIELPGLNGIAVGNYIRELSKNEWMHIIYISSKTSYAMELFKIHPYDFFIKPVNKEKLCMEIKTLLQLDKQDKRFFIYNFNKQQHKVLVCDIIYFKSERKYINIITADGNMHYIGKLKDTIIKLPASFVMVGQSEIINIKHIKDCCENSVVMDNGDEVVISRKYKNNFNIKMIEYNMNYHS